MSIKKLVWMLSATTVACGLGASTASAQNYDATVTYEVQSVTLLNLSGSASVTINSGTAGGGLTDATDSSGVTYAITNNAGSNSKKLTGKINTAMTSPTTLSVNVTAPSGASSTGYVELTASDQDLVTGIDDVDASGIAIAFKLHTTVAAGVVASATKTFTMTVTGS